MCLNEIKAKIKIVENIEANIAGASCLPHQFWDVFESKIIYSKYYRVFNYFCTSHQPP